VKFRADHVSCRSSSPGWCRGRPPGPGNGLGEARTARQRRLRELPWLCHRGGRRGDLPTADPEAARRGQAPVRPWQPVHRQPQHPASV